MPFKINKTTLVSSLEVLFTLYLGTYRIIYFIAENDCFKGGFLFIVKMIDVLYFLYFSIIILCVIANVQETIYPGAMYWLCGLLSLGAVFLLIPVRETNKVDLVDRIETVPMS